MPDLRPLAPLRPRPFGLAARLGEAPGPDGSSSKLLVLDIADPAIRRDLCTRAGRFDVVTSQRDSFVACQGPALLAFVRHLLATWPTAAKRASRVVFPTDPETLDSLEAFDGSHGFGIDAVLCPAEDALVARFQPIIDLTDGEVLGFEGLVRAELGDRTIPPTRLFALARDAARLRELDEAATTAILRAASGALRGRRLFVNCDPSTLDVARVEGLVRAAALLDVPAEQVVIELVNADRVTRLSGLVAAVARARRHGLRIAVDEVGTGFGTADLLSRLRPEYLKVSMALTRQLPGTTATVGALCAIGDHLGARVVLTGVETAAEEEHAGSLGIRTVQGFRYGPLSPRPVVEAAPCSS